ncbi:MAG: hypothetical protein KUA43_23095 [Hoeflea sp.]|uniref:hypothetical protein n=1 Tax=Hoeflea sp. TaxID=1940281 RepID=UPI001DFEBE27|nr:hypothetical protein [Hoeflea sp.]MBU4530739.1 hypothetical protein [Alphaproteobacteria bacterium]MBU4544738.1 hypothetical protein [Alphaproteobacteria bacterium]MBU4549294.1 hypothetical protein [Alphaproteobacteria bacterium]MBV1726333.1 hypothetical protein [Hoeflea sp.]MBV1761675.1 hypothetical protein [Hoeflea sp.]
MENQEYEIEQRDGGWAYVIDGCIPLSMRAARRRSTRPRVTPSPSRYPRPTNQS